MSDKDDYFMMVPSEMGGSYVYRVNGHPDHIEKAFEMVAEHGKRVSEVMDDIAEFDGISVTKITGEA